MTKSSSEIEAIIQPTDESGVTFAAAEGLSLTVVPWKKDCGGVKLETKNPNNPIKHRVGIEIRISDLEEQKHHRWLMGELNGVRVYVIRSAEDATLHMILSDLDLRP